MPISEQALLVFCSAPTVEAAQALAQSLIVSKLAACVQVLPGIHSYFYWENKLECAQESILLIKTTPQAFDTVQAHLLKHHPYQVPEIIAIPVIEGNASYLDWLNNTVKIPPYA